MSREVDFTIAQPRNGGRTLQLSSQTRLPSSTSNRLVMLPPESARAASMPLSRIVRVMPSGAKMRSAMNCSSGTPAALSMI